MITYELTLTDTRRVDLVTQFLLAVGSPSTAILGTIGALSSTPEPLNPTFRVVAVDATVGAVMLAYDSGPLPTSAGIGTPQSLAVGSDGKALEGRSDAFWSVIDSACLQVANTGQGFDYQGGIHYRAAFGLNIAATFLMDGIAADILDGSGNYLQTFGSGGGPPPVGYISGTLFGTQTTLSTSGLGVILEPFQPTAVTFNGVLVPQSAIILPWAASQPSVGATFKLRVYSVNTAKIFTVVGHPIDLLTQWWTNVGITYDATAAAAVRHQLGDDKAVKYRFDLSTNADLTLYDAVQRYLTAPFGFSWRVDTQQRRVLFVCRDLSLLTLPSGTFGPAGPLTPVETLGINDLRNGEAASFDLDERSIKNRVVVTWQDIQPWDAEKHGGTRPPDGMVAVPMPPIIVDYSTNGLISVGGTPAPDSIIAGLKEWRVDLPGFVGQTVVNAPVPGTVQAFDMTQWATQLAIGVFNRVGRGAPLVTLPVIRGHSIADGGDIIATTAPHIVNTYLDLFPVSQRIKEGGGSRLLQVVQITPNPDGPDLLCWDVGPGTAVGTEPTFTLAADATDPYHVAVATLTNPTDMVALGAGTQVLVQFAVGASPPTVGGQPAGAIDPTSATLDLALPPVNGGSTVWARMAASVPGLGPSAWSSWASVDLTALPPPTGLGAAATANGTDVLLTWTPGSTLFPEAVYQDGVLLAVLPPGTDHFLVEGVSGSHTYTVKTIDPAPLAGASTAASTSGAPTGGVTLTAPIDPAAFAGTHDANGVLVIDGTYGLEVTATAIPSTVAFEVAIETAVGSGTYGSYVVMAQLAAVQGGRTRFTTRAAQNDGLRREIRARSLRNGATSSSYTTAQVVDPWSQQTLPPAPPRLTAVWGAGSLAVFLQGDPQTVSFKIAASTSGYPSDATVRAATALDATNNQATTAALVTGLVVNDLVYVTAFAYTLLAGGGTESAHAQATFVYGGGAAPVDASYTTVTDESARLPQSRHHTAGLGIIETDGGAGSTFETKIDTTVVPTIADLGSNALQAADVDLAFLDHPDGVMLDGVPSAEAAVRVQDARQFDASPYDQARLVAAVDAAGVAGTKAAFRYSADGGSTWAALDGASGPVQTIAATGPRVSPWVALVAGAMADVLFGWIPYGGDGATQPVLTQLALQFRRRAAVLACTVDPSRTEDVETYADTTALLAAWPETDPASFLTPTLSTDFALSGSHAIKLDCASGGPYGQGAYLSRTYGGFTPGEHVRVTCGALANRAPSSTTQNKKSLIANGVEAVLQTGISADTWYTLTADCVADGSGNILVQVGFFNMIAVVGTPDFLFYVDLIQFYPNCP